MPETATPNKVKYGLKNVHYAPLTYTNGAPSFGTPVAIPGAVNLSLSPQGSTDPFYADDGVYFVADENAGYQGDLEIAIVPESFRVYALGEEKDAKGVLAEKTDKKHGLFALLFEFSGDQKKIRHVLYCCHAARPEVTGQTNNQSKNVQTETLNITAVALQPYTVVKRKTSDETDDTVYEGWYGSVYLPETDSTP